MESLFSFYLKASESVLTNRFVVFLTTAVILPTVLRPTFACANLGFGPFAPVAFPPT